MFTIDGDGNRRTPTKSNNNSETKKILFSGGSTAFGTGAPSDRDTIPSHFQGKTEGFTVINQAVIGHLLAQEMLKYLVKGVSLNPQLVISISGWNDFNQISHKVTPKEYIGLGEWFQLDLQLQRLRQIDNDSIILRISFFY